VAYNGQEKTSYMVGLKNLKEVDVLEDLDI
jgi:hypothetical protein